MPRIKYFQLSIILLFLSFAKSFAQSDTVQFQNILSEALDNNFGIRIARNNATVVSNSNTPGNAGFLPVLNIVAADGKASNDAKLTFSDPNRAPVERKGAKSSTVNALAELDWTVFDGFRMFATKEKLSEMDKIGQLQLRWEIENLYVALAADYYQLSQEQKLKQVLQTSIGISRARLVLAEKKFQVGSASELDLNQAKIDFSTDSTLLISQDIVIKNLVADINVLTGRSPEIYFSAGYDFDLNQLIDYDRLKENLQQQNINLLIARGQMNVYYQQIKETRSSFLPSVTLYGNYAYTKSTSEVGLLLSNQNNGYGYGIRFNYNLFNGMNDKTDLANAKINFNSSEINAEQVMIQAEANLLKSYNSYVGALQVVSLEKVNLQNTSKNLKIAFEKYRLGAINEIDFRNIQRTAIEAENRLLTAEYLAKIAEINMLQLSGSLSL
jgi:outer membrane protein